MAKTKETYNILDKSIEGLEKTAIVIGSMALLLSLVEPKFISTAAIAAVSYLGLNQVKQNRK